MLLSILIPVFNYPCASFVEQLHRQAMQLGIAFEILVADDGSTAAATVQANRRINDLPHARYVELGQNHGRPYTRNWLVSQAQGQSLLMMDCDASPTDEHFVERYLPYMGSPQVVCGGILHTELLPSPRVSLRHRYEKRMEPLLTAERRNRHPYACLRTFNLMMPLLVARQIPFDEGITRYGYEDTLLGAQLQRANVPVVHIDNPLLHLDLDDNARFLTKTEESMHTLSHIAPQMQSHSLLLSHYQRLSRLQLVWLVRWLFGLLQPLLRRHLLGAKPSVLLFQAYKLGYFCTIHSTSK